MKTKYKNIFIASVVFLIFCVIDIFTRIIGLVLPEVFIFKSYIWAGIYAFIGLIVIIVYFVVFFKTKVENKLLKRFNWIILTLFIFQVILVIVLAIIAIASHWDKNSVQFQNIKHINWILIIMFQISIIAMLSISIYIYKQEKTIQKSPLTK